MPRRAVQFCQGHYYHLYNRTAGDRLMCPEAENARYLLRHLKGLALACQIAIIAYCLMPNHYHLLVRQDGDHTPGDLLRRLFGGYTRSLNRWIGMHGVLFESRYKAILVEQEPYVLHLCAYIHANPVKARLVARPEDWAFSNYQEWIGTRPGTLIDHAFVCERFVDGQAYARFVDDYIAGANPMPQGAFRYELDCRDEGKWSI